MFKKMHKDAPNMSENTTHFGYKNVAWEEKSSLVRGVFERVAGRYDLMNDVMSFGMHRLWKDRFVRQVRANKNSRCLDVAGGTGDIAVRIKSRLGADVTLCDINAAMLKEGRNRSVDNANEHGLLWTCGNAELLPFSSNSQDVYTIAFGIRNVTDIPAALSEAVRVLDYGGQFLCLEFSPDVSPILKPIYDVYSFSLLPKLGQWIAGDRDSYQYLAESIRQFPSQKRFCDLMQQVGLSRVHTTPLSGGICTIFEGVKL